MHAVYKHTHAPFAQPCLIMNLKLLSSVLAAVLAFLSFRALNKPLGTNHVQRIMSTDPVISASKFSDPAVLAEVAKIRCAQCPSRVNHDMVAD